MALDDFSKGYYEKRRAMMGRAPVQDSGDVMRKVNKQAYQAEQSRPILEQAAAEMQTEGRERSVGERIGKTVSGAAKSYLSSLTNAGGDAARTQGGLWRDFTRDSVREWQQEIDRWERDLSAWRADGSLTREEEEDLTGMIQANREKIATYTMAQEGRRGSAEAARGLADEIALSGARDTDQAKEGLGAAGQFAVDAGTALAQMAGDIALGTVSGGSAMIPMAVRSYGGSSQKARLEGASDDRAALYGLASAALETGTELLGNVGRISSKFFGGGAVDDVVEGMVRALERKGGGKLSRALLNRAGTAAAGFVTEGAEEALSAIIDPFLRRAIYSDDPLDAGEILGDALYDFAVGGAVGGIAGGIGGTDTTRGLRSAERNADAAIDRAYDAMGSSGPWSPTAAEAVREANGLLEQAAWAAAETGGISGKAADRILRDESALEQLRQQTGLELSGDMTQSERRAAVKKAANRLAVLQKEQGQAGVRAVEGEKGPAYEERRADGDIGPNGVANRTAGGENRTAGGEKQTAAKRAYDAKRVRDGARAFGESGAKALAAAYDGRTDAESYYGGFAAYYQAGISNMDMRKVRSEYGAQLSEAQKYAAYVAGQNDAILSIQRERQAAPYAKSAGSDSGLVYDDFVRQAVESGRAIEDVNGETRSYLTAETAERVNSVAKALGLRVRFVDQVDGDRANASIQGSEVQIQKNNPLPVQFLMGHEVTHRLQKLAPEEYRTFREAAAQDEMVQIYARRYAEGDSGLTYEQALDEAAADYAGRMMEDGKVLDRFIEAHKENRTLLEKVRDAIRAIVRKLTGAEKKQAQTAEGKLTTALEAAAKRAETLQKRQGDGTMDTTRYSLKEDGKNGRQEIEQAVQRGMGQDYSGGAQADGRVGQEDGGDGYVLSVRGMSQGQRPVHSWAEKGLTTPRKGSVAENEARIAGAEYGLPVFVVRDNLFVKHHPKAPAFAAGGQVFMRETLPKAGKDDIGVHEAGHAMKQLQYPPYMDYLEQMPELIDRTTLEGKKLMEGAAKHLNVDLFDCTDSDMLDVYDEICNMVYGAIHAGRTEILELVRPAFFDFDTYAAELSEIHEQFKRERRDTQTHKSRKGFSVDRELDREIRQIVKEAREGGKSEEAVQADIRVLVQESYQRMAEQYGTIPTGERAAREVRAPRKTSEDKKVSQTVRTILEAGATPETAIPNIEELTARGVFSYTQYTDKQAIKDAEGTIRDKGYASALSDWTNRVRSGEVSKRNTAEGWALYNNAANSGDMKSAMTILTNMVEHQRNAAQAVQATRILKQLPPDVQLYGVAHSVRNLQEELTRRYGKNAPDLKIDEELAGRVLSARTQKARDEALQELYRDIGRQLPSRFVDKWNAWRYLAMLGNVRTHVRNVLGNFFFAPVVATKDLTATAIEAAVSRVSGGKLNRSKALVGAGKGDRALLKAAWGDYANVQDAAMSGRKYDDLSNANQYIEEGRVIFKTKALEQIRRANSRLLEGEDQLFSKPHYAYAMAQYCKANGITAEQIAAGKGLDRAREYAVLEAQKATYRDTNAFSYLISRRFREQGEYKNAAHAANMLADGVLPFRKTPANILVRGVEYSPLGLLNGLKQALWDVRQGTKTGAEAIDSISAGLTGTGLMALGIYLAAEGLIRGHGSDDDKEKQFEELMGHQAYALELPDGTSVTLDWLAPEALPFFVGVNLWEQTGKGKEQATLADLLSATATVTEPLLEMSCLQSLNAVFDAVGYARDEGMDGLTKALASAATSFLTQAQPTLLGQVERTLEDKRYTTYLEQDGFLTGDMQYALGKASARVPGWDFQQIPYIDAWGRTEGTGTAGVRSFNNFLNPAYTSSVNESEMEQELLRLYQATGTASVLPRRAERSFPVNGEEKHLNAGEYVKYAQEKGQTAYTILEELTRSESYGAMNDEERAEAVSKAYAYAGAWAKTRVSDYEPEDWTRKAIEVCRDTGVKPAVYVPLYLEQGSVHSLKDKNGETIDNSAGLLKMELVYRQKGLNDKQRQALFKAFGVGKSVMHLNKAAVAEKLARMRKQAG